METDPGNTETQATDITMPSTFTMHDGIPCGRCGKNDFDHTPGDYKKGDWVGVSDSNPVVIFAAYSNRGLLEDEKPCTQPETK